MKYELVEAESQAEAIEKSGLKIGALARVVDVIASSAGGKKYSVFPVVEVIQEIKLEESNGK